MVIGKGLIASAFSKLSEDKDIIVFASGVSNSNETDNRQFERERELLMNQCSRPAYLVYFSTVSLFDKSLQSSKYLRHKQKMEDLISENFQDWVVFRLPNIIGPNGNSNTLLNYFYTRIVSGQPVKIYNNASRYIMDIEDASKLLTPLIEKRVFTGQGVNACLPQTYPITRILTSLEEAIGKRAKATYLEKGCQYYVELGPFNQYLEEIGYQLDPNYLDLVISKYFGRRPLV